jgi:hypothetical protein
MSDNHYPKEWGNPKRLTCSCGNELPCPSGWMRNVKIIKQYQVTRKCGHEEQYPISYGLPLLKQLTQTTCDACEYERPGE